MIQLVFLYVLLLSALNILQAAIPRVKTVGSANAGRGTTTFTVGTTGANAGTTSQGYGYRF